MEPGGSFTGLDEQLWHSTIELSHLPAYGTELKRSLADHGVEGRTTLLNRLRCPADQSSFSVLWPQCMALPNSPPPRPGPTHGFRNNLPRFRSIITCVSSQFLISEGGMGSPSSGRHGRSGQPVGCCWNSYGIVLTRPAAKVFFSFHLVLSARRAPSNVNFLLPPPPPPPDEEKKSS